MSDTSKKRKGFSLAPTSGVDLMADLGDTLNDFETAQGELHHVDNDKIVPDPANKRFALRFIFDNMHQWLKLNTAKSLVKVSQGKQPSLTLPNFEEVKELNRLNEDSIPEDLTKFITISTVEAEWDALTKMAQDVFVNGVMQPIELKPIEDSNKYMIVMGHRRYASSILAGLSFTPALYKSDIKDDEAKGKRRVAENIVRKNLTLLGVIMEIQDFLESYQERMGKAPKPSAILKQVPVQRQRLHEYMKLLEAFKQRTNKALMDYLKQDDAKLATAFEMLNSTGETKEIDEVASTEPKAKPVVKSAPFKVRNVKTASRLIKAVTEEFNELGFDLSDDISDIDGLLKELKAIFKQIDKADSNE